MKKSRVRDFFFCPPTRDSYRTEPPGKQSGKTLIEQDLLNQLERLASALGYEVKPTPAVQNAVKEKEELPRNGCEPLPGEKLFSALWQIASRLVEEEQTSS